MASNTQLLSVGQQCSESSCLLVDFLPFKCQHCAHSFCGEHFHVEAHRCSQYDETRHNRIAPSCPLCNTPVAIPPGDDPNIRMERHISAECSVMTGKSGRPRSQPTCARGKCGKVLYAPIACSACKKLYCPQHRFPKDHSCANLASNTTSSSKSHNASLSTSSRLFARMPSKQTSNPSSSGSHPIPSLSGASASANITLSNPFSKTDRIPSPLASPTEPASLLSPPSPTANPTPSPAECRTRSNSHIAKFLDPFRAKAEKESRRKAMLERAKKGLLTEQEKVLLAEEEAQRAKEVSKGGKECTMM